MQLTALHGAGYFLRGLGLTFKPGLRRFVAVPLLINVTLFALLIYFGAGQISALLDWALPSWLEWLRWLVWPLFALAAALVVFVSFSLLGNLIAGPFNGFLAEAVERRLAGQGPPPAPGWSRIAAETARSIASQLRKLLYIATYAIPLLILSVIPGLNVAAAPLWVLFSAWMLAVEYADYPMANHGLRFARQRELLSQRRFLSLGFGAAVMLALVVPIVNFVVIPAAVAGASAMWVERFAESARERSS